MGIQSESLKHPVKKQVCPEGGSESKSVKSRARGGVLSIERTHAYEFFKIGGREQRIIMVETFNVFPAI